MKTTTKIKWCLLFFFITTSVVWEPPVFAQMFPRRGEEQFAPRRPFQRPRLAEDEPTGEEAQRRRQGGLFGQGFEQRREQHRQRIERAHNMARRLLDDPNTPAEVKTKARRLDSLLTERDALEDELVAKRQGFLRNHKQELDELRQLRERAEVLRQNLRSSREKAISENLPKIQEMRRLTDEARQTAQELRQQYRGMRGGQDESR